MSTFRTSQRYLSIFAAFLITAKTYALISSTSRNSIQQNKVYKYERNQQLNMAKSNTWTNSVGSSALTSVENLAQSVTRANEDPYTPLSKRTEEEVSPDRGTGNTAPVFRNSDTSPKAYNKNQNRKVVQSALESLERDMQLLDNITAEKPQLSQLEITLLTVSVALSGSGPMFFPAEQGYKIAEVLAPACAAFSAAIGIGAEYTGKVAVADGKEVAACTLQCAAEAEALLAKAERVKAVSPLCVGISATAATLSLVAPVVVESFSKAIGATSGTPFRVMNEFYLLSPLVGVLSAAVASLSLQETRQFASRAISVGNRRFAKSGLVGRTWLSLSEQIEQGTIKTTERWKSFAWNVLPAPIIGSLIPGELSTKAVIVSAFAAAQCAYFLAESESALARGTDAVALKSRSAAVADTYANQGSRSAAILPFTSALSSLCAAATAAIVELPWLESLAAVGGVKGAVASAGLVSFFPFTASLFAAAASVSKARCEVDSEAAIQAASTLALEYDEDDDPILKPFTGVIDLIRVTVSTSWKSFKMSRLSRNVLQPIAFRLKSIFRRGNNGGEETA